MRLLIARHRQSTLQNPGPDFVPALRLVLLGRPGGESFEENFAPIVDLLDEGDLILGETELASTRHA